jgi:hypothetical protein
MISSNSNKATSLHFEKRTFPSVTQRNKKAREPTLLQANGVRFNVLVESRCERNVCFVGIVTEIHGVNNLVDIETLGH